MKDKTRDILYNALLRDNIELKRSEPVLRWENKVLRQKVENQKKAIVKLKARLEKLKDFEVK